MRRGASDLLAALAAGGAAAVAARAAYTALRRRPPAGEKTWTRVNHRGDDLTLLEGPALALGAIAVELASAALSQGKERTEGTERVRGSAHSGFPAPVSVVTSTDGQPGSEALAIALAGVGALGFGVLDDLAGSGKRKGLRGHLGALRHGEVTTGAVKLGGIGATGLAAGLTLGGDPADVAINAGLIAGGANLLNLFDLRPGRAIKVATLSAALIAAGAAMAPPDECGIRLAMAGPLPHSSASGRPAGLETVAAPLGAALALLREDLGERAMLGDAGANALGAMLGAAAAASLPRRARIGALAAVIALTAASEKVSFTKVIQRTPPLHWLDMLGRRPADSAAAGPSAAVPASPVSLSGMSRSHAAAAGTVQAQADRGRGPRRRPGRHRRSLAGLDPQETEGRPRAGETWGGDGVSRTRSGALFFKFFFRVPARQEP